MIGGVTRHSHVISPIWGPPPPCKHAGTKTETSITIKTLGKQSNPHLAVCSSGLLCVPGRPLLGVPASMESLQLKVAFIFFI